MTGKNLLININIGIKIFRTYPKSKNNMLTGNNCKESGVFGLIIQLSFSIFPVLGADCMLYITSFNSHINFLK